MKDLKQIIVEAVQNDNLTGHKNPGSRAHFIKLVNAHNKYSSLEHYQHVFGDSKRSKERQAAHDAKLTQIKSTFLEHFGHLVDKKDRKDFSLTYYDTDSPEKMADTWGVK